MKKLRFSEMAERDLDQIWNYIATKSGNVDTAKRFVESLLSRLSILAREPKAGTARDGIDTALRGLPIGRHVVYYRDEGVLSCSFCGSFTGLASKAPPTTKICLMVSLTPTPTDNSGLPS